MNFLSRLSTLLKADAHGMVDALEERSLLLRQHLREARNAVAQQRDHLEAIEAQIQDVAAASKRFATRREALDADIALALEQQQEELARFAIRKLLPVGRRLAEIDRRHEELEAQRDELTTRLAEQEAELQELRLQVQDYLQRREAAESEGGWPHGIAGEEVVADEEVELELLRRRSAQPQEATP